MEEYPSNSIRPSTPKVRRPAPTDDTPERTVAHGTEDKVVRRVVSGKAIKRKKSMGSRLREIFGGKDGQSVPDYVMYEVLGPALKDMITDAVIQGVERMVYGEARHSTRRSTSHRGPVGSNSHIAYNRYSGTPAPRDHQDSRIMSQRGRGSHDFGEIVLSTRAEAEETLAQMDDIIGRFGTTSIADLYEMLAIDEVYHTDEKWGWDNLRGSDVQRLRNGGYILVLPKPIPIG